MNPGTPGPDDETTRPQRIAEAYERYHGLGQFHQRPQSYRQIGIAMGVSHPTVSKWVREGEQAATSRDMVEQLMAKRSLLNLTAEITRYGMGLLGIDDPDLTPEERQCRWEGIMPDLNRSIDTVAKLTGAYAPVRSEVAMNAEANVAINAALDDRRAAHQARLEQERRQQIEGS